MLIAGAWHGAGWTYIIWGGFHGILLAIYHTFKKIRANFFKLSVLNNPFYHFGSILLTFSLVVVGWVFFRAPDLQTAWIMLQKMGQFPQLFSNLANAFHEPIILAQMLFLLACCFTGPWIMDLAASLYRPLPYWYKVPIACAIFLLSVVMLQTAAQPFIYFQF